MSMPRPSFADPALTLMKEWLHKLLKNHPQGQSIAAVLNPSEQEQAITELAQQLLSLKKTDAGKFNQLQNDPEKMNFLVLTTCLNEKSNLKMSGKDLIDLALTPEHLMTQSPQFRKLKVGIANEVTQLENEDKKEDKTAAKENAPTPELSIGLTIIRLLLSPFKLKPTPDKKSDKENNKEEEEELKLSPFSLLNVLSVIMSMLFQAKVPGQKSLTDQLTSEDQSLINTFGINIKDGTRETTVQEIQAPGTSTSTADEIASAFTDPLEDVLTGTKIEEQGPGGAAEEKADAAASEATEEAAPKRNSPFKTRLTPPGSD